MSEFQQYAVCILATIEDHTRNTSTGEDRADALEEIADAIESLDDHATAEIDGAEWLILDENARDRVWDEVLQNYIDECLEIPESMRYYFDDEKWKRDARFDGAGHALSSYDGCEIEVSCTDIEPGLWFYCYRTN